MADAPGNESSKREAAPLDPSELRGLDFGPEWTKRSASKEPSRPRKDNDPASKSSAKPKAKKGAPPKRDRRQGGDPKRETPAQSAKQPLQPTVDIDFFPQDEAFNALVARLRKTARTYQLFEIARLILEKPERFVVVVANKKREGESEPAPLYYSVPGHLPFPTEDEAIRFATRNYLDRYFDVEEIETDPPKGDFPRIHRCGITGELIGPPNYHRYQELLRRHFEDAIRDATFEQFRAKLETLEDQAAVDGWLEKMRRRERFVPKERRDDDPEYLESREAARQFLARHRKDAIVGSGASVRFAGRDIDKLPDGDIRRSIEAYHDDQQRFPLDTANNLRGRLRRHKFTVYKKGAKGVSYVCAVKRRFRDEDTVFSDSIQGLIDFIERNPLIPASKLPAQYLGIDTEKQRPETLNVSEAEVAQAKEELERSEGEAAQPPDERPEPGPEATTSADPRPKQLLSEEEQAKLNRFANDLRWLITEGYVTEYGDGALYAPPPAPKPKKKQADGERNAPETSAPDDPERAEAKEGVEEAAEEGRNASPQSPGADERP